MMCLYRNETDEELELPDYTRDQLRAMQDAKQSLKADVAELEGKQTHQDENCWYSYDGHNTVFQK